MPYSRAKKTSKSKSSKSRALTPAQKADVTRLINKKSIDYKTRFGAVPAGFSAITNLLSPALNYDITNIPRYDALTVLKDTCRQGDRVKISSIRLNGALRIPAGGTGSTAVRLMLVRHCANAGAAIVANDVLQHNAFDYCAYSTIEHNNPYQVLMDKRYVLDSNGKGLVPIDKVIRFKRPLVVEYDPSLSSGAVPATRDGNIELLICADTGQITPEESLTSQITFFDY